MSLRFEKYKDKPTSCSEIETNYITSTRSNEDNIQKHTHIFPTLTSISINCVIGEDTLKTITIQLSQDIMISTIIDKAIIEFNKEFTKEKAKIVLRDDLELFVLKPAKKNGKPKVDMPYYSSDITISETQSVNFALCLKEDSDDYVKMFTKVKRKTCEAGCILY